MNANEQQTLFLPAGQVLSVVAASGASGSAIRMAKLPGGGDAQSITAIAGASLTLALMQRRNALRLSARRGL